MLDDTTLQNPDIKKISDEILSIRKDVDLIWYDGDISHHDLLIEGIRRVSLRLSSLYSSLYRDLCK